MENLVQITIGLVMLAVGFVGYQKPMPSGLFGRILWGGISLIGLVLVGDGLGVM